MDNQLLNICNYKKKRFGAIIQQYSCKLNQLIPLWEKGKHVFPFGTLSVEGLDFLRKQSSDNLSNMTRDSDDEVWKHLKVRGALPWAVQHYLYGVVISAKQCAVAG